ncbi:MAG: serine hydrolase [Eubacteriales bacterium]|nr:serine hydrolase [Eubacteriales bacterium]
MKKENNKLPVTIIAIVASIILLIGIGFGVKTIIKDVQNNKQLADASSTTSEEPPSTEDITTEATTEETTEVPNWFADAHVMNPTKTEKTISLPKADLSVFENDDTQIETGENAEAKGPWEQVTLSLDSVPGSINLSSPGEASKTTQLTSTYMILVDLDSEEVIAERDSDKIINPASMTKILTVITARDYITEENLDDTFTITDEIVQEVNAHGLNAVGFSSGDVVTVRDLLYGTIVCSGGDAAYGLAEYCAGSQEAFVEKMNENVEKLGLSETAHFTNPVGNYDENLHCTMRDMSIILSVAIQDEMLSDVLSLRIYNTDSIFPQEKESEADIAIEVTTPEDESTTEEKEPAPIEISNWFLRRIEDKEFLGNVIAAKTGFVNQSGFCAASYYEADNGKRYICVTGNAYSSWRAIYDHVGVYRSYTN